MEVILLEKVGKLGALGDRVIVKSGYARNFLFPTGRAVVANEKNIAEFDNRRAELEEIAKKAIEAANARKEEIDGKVVEIKAKAGDEGKLFGSVGTRDIVQVMQDLGLGIEKSEVKLVAGPLRILGDHQVQCQLHPEVFATVTVSIIGE